MLTPDEANRLMAAVRAAIAPFVEKPGAPVTVGQAVEAVTTPKAAHDPSDPVVKLLPKNWKGEDYRGRRYSETTPNFLGMLSHMLDSFATKNDADPERQRYARWDRENAEAARKWRARLEAQHGQQPNLPSVESLADEGVL
jgi:hypothetical protein